MGCMLSEASHSNVMTCRGIRVGVDASFAQKGHIPEQVCPQNTKVQLAPDSPLSLFDPPSNPFPRPVAHQTVHTVIIYNSRVPLGAGFRSLQRPWDAVPLRYELFEEVFVQP